MPTMKKEDFTSIICDMLVYTSEVLKHPSYVENIWVDRGMKSVVLYGREQSPPLTIVIHERINEISIRGISFECYDTGFSPGKYDVEPLDENCLQRIELTENMILL